MWKRVIVASHAPLVSFVRHRALWCFCRVETHVFTEQLNVDVQSYVEKLLTDDARRPWPAKGGEEYTMSLAARVVNFPPRGFTIEAKRKVGDGPPPIRSLAPLDLEIAVDSASSGDQTDDEAFINCVYDTGGSYLHLADELGWARCGIDGQKEVMTNVKQIRGAHLDMCGECLALADADEEAILSLAYA